MTREVAWRLERLTEELRAIHETMKELVELRQAKAKGEDND